MLSSEININEKILRTERYSQHNAHNLIRTKEYSIFDLMNENQNLISANKITHIN
jgi:hypothetical protein